ncbi:hypothetical protein J2S53_003968 [Actinopolyspora lacussalsi]|uniref:hypothetical protein n=1 Tax=Actinopolyspora righensis TaxID=995060 RepID=UPI000B884B3F|nr:hypothetical protein [Actinopolyspora righensis]MDP9644023.1 hypothetical protein [Actinopolyspora lacussalsi]
MNQQEYQAGRQPASRRRSRSIDEIFGDVLPETTADERDGSENGGSNSWYIENRPPHHDS